MSAIGPQPVHMVVEEDRSVVDVAVPAVLHELDAGPLTRCSSRRAAVPAGGRDGSTRYWLADYDKGLILVLVDGTTRKMPQSPDLMIGSRPMS
jgi:hypothetical protein